MADQNSQFYAILTNVGAAKLANANALGIAFKIAQMGVGDANGAEPSPNATQTALVNEWRRAPLNQLKVDDKDPSVIVAEQVIPADIGGRWIREICLYDDGGDMVAVANCPPTYKPLLSQGSGRTQIVRMSLVVSSTSSVQLKIDPSVVLATREWVTEELARQDFKYSVLVATVGAITLSGLQTVDGQALTAGASVLVKNQAAAKDNGIYQVVAGGPWIRRPDADTSAKVTPGLLVHVERGAVNGDSLWQLVTDSPISLGVTALAFEMVFGRTGVAAGTYRSVTVDANGRVLAASNPTTVAGYGLTDVYTKTQADQALALKANLTSPDLLGAPTAPTPPLAASNTRLATTEFVMRALGGLVNSAPAALDTLSELAAAIGNDPNFAATMTSLLAAKAPLASPSLTGVPTAPTAAAGTNNLQLATTAFVQALGSLKANSASPTFTGTPTAPTPPLAVSNTQIATTEFVARAVAALVDSSPGALDTLNELAAALGNDPNFAASMNALLAGKAAKATTLAGYGITDAMAFSQLLADFVSNGGWGLGQNSPKLVGDANTAIYPGFYSAGGMTATNFGDAYSPLMVMRRQSGNVIGQMQINARDNLLYFRGSVDNGANWSKWDWTWHSSNLVKNTSPTDTTPGSMLRNGDHGIGGQAVSAEVDLAKYRTGGKFITPASGLVGLPAGWAQGRHVVEVAGGDGYCMQRLTGASANKGRSAYRIWDGAWAAWDEHVTASIAFGMGQASQNMTASRTWATNYTNTTNKTIVVSINVRDPANGNLSASLWVAGELWANAYMSGGSQTTLTAHVPPGAAYRIDREDTNDQILKWMEYR